MALSSFYDTDEVVFDSFSLLKITFIVSCPFHGPFEVFFRDDLQFQYSEQISL